MSTSLSSKRLFYMRRNCCCFLLYGDSERERERSKIERDMMIGRVKAHFFRIMEKTFLFLHLYCSKKSV